MRVSDTFHLAEYIQEGFIFSVKQKKSNFLLSHGDLLGQHRLLLDNIITKSPQLTSSSNNQTRRPRRLPSLQLRPLPHPHIQNALPKQTHRQSVLLNTLLRPPETTPNRIRPTRPINRLKTTVVQPNK